MAPADLLPRLVEIIKGGFTLAVDLQGCPEFQMPFSP